MDQLGGSPVCCAHSTGGSDGARAWGSPRRWDPSCRLPRHVPPRRGMESSPWALGHRAGPFPSRGPTLVSALQRMGSSPLFCKDMQRRINFHLLWFSTSNCIQPFGLLTPLPLPVPDKLMNFR